MLELESSVPNLFNTTNWDGTPDKIPLTFAVDRLSEPESFPVPSGWATDLLTAETLIPEALGNDVLFGEAGDDRLSGNEGNDTLYGGEGNDRLLANDIQIVVDPLDLGLPNTGNDISAGEPTHNFLYGNQGDDTLERTPGANILSGGQNDDLLTGGAGNDALYGDLGKDTLIGIDPDAGMWSLRIGEVDTLTGGAGADTFINPGILDTYLYRDSLVTGGQKELMAIVSGVSGLNLDSPAFIIDSPLMFDID